jgi:hypothetical protein
MGEQFAHLNFGNWKIVNLVTIVQYIVKENSLK